MDKAYVKYFLKIALAMYLVPIVIIFLSLAIAAIAAITAIGEAPLLISAFLVIVGPCVFAFCLGRRTSRRQYCPESRTALYAPAFFRAAVFPVLAVIAELFKGNEAVHTLALVPNIFAILGSYFYTDSYGKFAVIYIPCFIIEILYGLIFVFGERISAKKQGITRKKITVKFIAAFAAYFAVLCGAAGIYDHYIYLTTVTIDDDSRESAESKYFAEGGYGFAYENGWSSVDLEPYYVENPDNRLAVLDESASLKISQVSDMPVLDGAEAAYPVYSAVANACYDNIADIQQYAKSWEGKEANAKMPVKFTNTIEAYKSLVSGDVDIFFGAAPSQDQKQLAADAGKELVYTPIGKEAFVFFVSESNPVNGLSSEQIRDIYSGKTNNWKKLGGKNLPVLAFQRPKNSGSQTMMEYFMGDIPLKEPLKIEYEMSMYGVISAVADYQNKETAIGYSFRYYASQMVFSGNDSGIKFLELDGVYPSPENISNDSYPMTAQLYAISIADNGNKYVDGLLQFMTSEQGRQLVRDTGYIV